MKIISNIKELKKWKMDSKKKTKKGATPLLFFVSRFFQHRR
jgi:hypothetical protein